MPLCNGEISLFFVRVHGLFCCFIEMNVTFNYSKYGSSWKHASPYGKLKNNAGLFIFESAKLCGLSGLCGSKYFVCGSIFYLGHNFYVGCMGQIYFCVG